MFDRKTGAINPAVVAYWQTHYDLAQRVTRLTDEQKRALRDRIHLWVGSEDSNYLDGAVRRFSDVIKTSGLTAAVTIVPGRTHFNLYEIGGDPLGLFNIITAEMAAAARKPIRH